MYLCFIALLMFQSYSKRKPNPETCEEDIEDLKSFISSFDGVVIPDEYLR